MESDGKILKSIAGRNGSKPTSANTGTKTFDAPAVGMTTREAVTISHFYNEKDEIVITGWENVAIGTNETIWFIAPVSKIVTTTGGLIQYYLA
jgi:hypothetical protein